MIRVQIKKDLERRLRKGENPTQLVEELVKILDEEYGKREIGSSKVKDGLGYKELVSLFRFHLGSDLVLPPEPHPTWVIRMVNTGKQMGVKPENVEQIVRGLRKAYPRGPYQLSFILQRADVHFAAGEAEQGDDDGKERRMGRIYTGRPELE